VLLTLASFWANGFWAHLLLRFGTGVASAWVLVMITALSQPWQRRQVGHGWVRWYLPAPDWEFF
jgi:hypothetical protein